MMNKKMYLNMASLIRRFKVQGAYMMLVDMFDPWFRDDMYDVLL